MQQEQRGVQAAAAAEEIAAEAALLSCRQLALLRSPLPLLLSFSANCKSAECALLHVLPQMADPMRLPLPLSLCL